MKTQMFLIGDTVKFPITVDAPKTQESGAILRDHEEGTDTIETVLLMAEWKVIGANLHKEDIVYVLQGTLHNYKIRVHQAKLKAHNSMVMKGIPSHQ